jgi:NTE family protein
MPEPQPGSALCLSGGGFRALHWHLGSLRVLNARGLLPRLAAISGVSAGSICAAWLGLRWPRLRFDAAGVAGNLEEEVIAPLRALAQLRIGVAAVASTLLPPLGAGNRLLARELDAALWRGARLGDLPARPRILLNAVDLDTAEAVRFGAAGLDHALWGAHPAAGVSLSQAVAASCAFTPFTAPAIVRLDPAAWGGAPGPARLLLADGVLQDNMGLDAIWDYATLLVSDSSLPRKLPSPVRPGWHSVLVHAQRVQFQFAREVRLARLRDAFAAGGRAGAYWGLRGALAAGGREAAPEAVPGTEALPQLLRTPGYLLRLPEPTQRGLEACGAALCAAALDLRTATTDGA